MLIQINATCLINMQHVIKIEAGNSTTEGQFILIHHTIHHELKFTKIFFEQDELARNAFIEKIINSYAHGDRICK